MVSLPGLRAIIESVSQERKLPKHAVQEALQAALLKGYERYRRIQSLQGPNFQEDYFDNFQVELDLEAEGFRVVASKTVVAKVNEPDREVALKALPVQVAQAKEGDTVVVDVTPQQSEFGRLAALQTKQVLAQKLQEQQCKLVNEMFGDRVGTVIPARVIRVERKGVIFGLSSGVDKLELEAELPNYERLPNDIYSPDAIFKVYLKKVFQTPKTKILMRVSRATTYLVSALLTNEVPEIQQQIVQIVAVARDAIPSSSLALPRTKIAVDTQQPDLDPVAVCMGEKNLRVQAAIDELRGETVEICRWSDDPATYIANALYPAQVQEVQIVNPETYRALVLVAAPQLPLAVGPEEQNLQLASRLTGWKIEVKTEASA